MLVFVTLPHHDFSCYVIVARHLPDMLYPCDQIFASHVRLLWPDNHLTDYVTLTDRRLTVLPLWPPIPVVISL